MPNAKPFGHSSPDNKEFIITDPLSPPRAQINFLWNDTIISGLNQFGSGDGWAEDSLYAIGVEGGLYEIAVGVPGAPYVTVR